jgi:hypothetical protein
MKTLTIRQPYASLIIRGIKDIENRTWSTSYRGPLLIHAGLAKPSKDDLQSVEEHCKVDLHDLQYGGIIGQVELVDCVEKHDSEWFFGPFGFVLANPRRLPFTPCKGRLGFFEFSPQGAVGSGRITGQKP